MTRLPSGRRSRRKPSPCQNRVGGVERSTSSTNPGLGLIGCFLSGSRRSKTTLTAPRRPAAPGVGDGLLVALERVGGRRPAIRGRPRRPGRWPGRRCAGGSRAGRAGLGPVGVGADQGRARGATAGPGRPRPCPACPTSTTRPAGPDHGQGLGERLGAAHAVEDDVGAAGQPAGRAPASPTAGARPGRAGRARPTASAPSASASSPLVGVLGPDHHRAATSPAGPGGARAATRGQPERAGADDRHHVAVGARRPTARRGRRRRSARP